MIKEFYCRAKFYGPTNHRGARFGICHIHRNKEPDRPLFYPNQYEYTDLDSFMRANNWEYLFQDSEWYYYRTLKDVSAPT